MIVERGARPDALPKPKRGGAGVVGVGVGLVFGLGANFAFVGAFGATHALKSAVTTQGLSAREC
jgi:hypothetical protein